MKILLKADLGDEAHVTAFDDGAIILNYGNGRASFTLEKLTAEALREALNIVHQEMNGGDNV